MEIIEIMSPTKKKYYAYVVPNGVSGVTDDWKKCGKIVSGVRGAKYRGFESKEEAMRWLAQGAHYEAKQVKKLEPGIYFDAGTGRGTGVEISVTDEKGKNLLHKVFASNKLNRFGKHLVDDVRATNNYGELLALRYALVIAKKEGIKKIMGDSRLVIDYWSRWHVKRKELPEETVQLARELAAMRDGFEKHDGTIERISGAHNPADLGFHR
jgi:ribonuclease HI